MDREILLERKINNIFNQVYKVNENVSRKNQDELIRGFEEEFLAIYEQIIIEKGPGGWLGKKAGQLVNFGKRTKDKAKDFYQKGKNLAKDTWNSVSKWVVQQFEKFENMLFKGIEYITSIPEKVDRAITKAFKWIFGKIASMYAKLKDKKEELGKYLSKVSENVMAYIASTWEKMKDKLRDSDEWIVKNERKLIRIIDTKKQSSSSWVKEKATQLLALLVKVKNGTIEAAKIIGRILLFLILGPIILVIEGTKALDRAAGRLLTKIKEMWAKEVGDFKVAYADERQNESLKYLDSFNNFK